MRGTPGLFERPRDEGGRAMWPVMGVVAGAAALAGVVVAALAARWPLAAPRVDPSTIDDEARRRPELSRFVRARVEPGAATGLVLTVAAAAVLLGGVAVGLLLLMVRRDVGFARWDLSAARWGAQHATAVSTRLLRDISQLGGTIGIITVALVAAIVEQRRIPSRSAPLFLLIVLVGQNLLANGAKLAVGRARPSISQLTGFAGSSFPSGHATAAAATFAAVALLLSRRRSPRARAILAGAAAAIAVAVATTRVLLGVHWLTDVLAGLALGWAWFALCSIAFGGRIMLFGAPVVVAEHLAADPVAPEPHAADTGQAS
ncbi:MAG TPA: phosphatase PAP2 family protein [Acidimicrobiales bacterium]